MSMPLIVMLSIGCMGDSLSDAYTYACALMYVPYV